MNINASNYKRKTMRKIFIPLVITLVCVTSSCTIDAKKGYEEALQEEETSLSVLDRVVASNTFVSENRKVGNFEGIDVAHAIHVKITNSPSKGEITVSAPDNVIKEVETTVTGNTLKIRVRKNLTLRNQKIEIIIPHQKIRNIKLTGASAVKADHQIKVDEFKADISGASDLDFNILSNKVNLVLSGASDAELKGNAQDLKLDASGASEFEAKELKVANAYVRVSGASKANVWATDLADIDASGASSVFYKNVGGLKTNFNTSGASKIKSY